MKFNRLKTTLLLVAYLFVSPLQKDATAQDCPPDALPANGIVYTLWNGFLDMTNVLEIINRGDTANSVIVDFFDINGVLQHNETRALNANEQNDIVLNDISAFEQDSFGVIKLTYTGEIDGRVTYYRGDTTFSNFEFAYAIPFSNPLQGESAVSFNTFQPSLAPEDANKFVANWLSILNLSPSTQSYVIKKYDQAGNLRSQSTAQVPAFGRTDVEAGHVSPGPNTVGLMIVEPVNTTHEYLAQVTRFGYDSTVPLPDFGFIFAVPLIAKCPSQEALFANVVTTYSEQGWLELVNISDFTTSYSVKMYTAASSLLLDTTMTIGPFAQIHTDLTELIPFIPGDHGFIRVEPVTSGGKFIAQVVHYIRSEGKLDTMFALQLKKTSSELIKSSFNLFLDTKNDIFTANTSSAAIELLFRNPANTKTPGAEVIPLSSDLFPNRFLVLLLELSSDTFGILTIRSLPSESIIAELFRVHMSPTTGQVDFVIPVPFR